MRIAFGVTALAAGMRGDGVDGIGTVARELIERLRAMPDSQVVPFEYARHPSGLIPGSLAVGDFKPQALLALATGLPFPRMQACLDGRVDLVHATDHFIPHLRRVPVLATLMDAMPLSHPEWVSYRFKTAKNALWRRSAQWADHIVTASEFSRQEIVRWFGVPNHKVSVVPLGVDQRWFEGASIERVQQVRERYALPERFFAFVGTIQPRKNVERLIHSYSGLPPQVARDCPLILIGREGWGCDTLVRALRAGSVTGVRWLNYVPHEDLPVVLGQARALVLPSLYEGFGLPVLEAFAAGVPVLTSSTTSLPEVAADAALQVDPKDVDGITEGMLELAHNDEVVRELSRKGRVRAAAFTWDQTVEKTREIYQQMISGR